MSINKFLTPLCVHPIFIFIGLLSYVDPDAAVGNAWVCWGSVIGRTDVIQPDCLAYPPAVFRSHDTI